MNDKLKSILKKLVTQENSDWEPLLFQAVLDIVYRDSKMAVPFLCNMFRRPSRLSTHPVSATDASQHDNERYAELLCKENQHSRRTFQKRRVEPEQTFSIGDEVLMAKGLFMPSFNDSPVFGTTYYRPCIIEMKNPLLRTDISSRPS